MRRFLLAAVAITLAWAGVRLAFFQGVAAPSQHDEFSYLLGADTFAHGRLANPPHPMARFFASPHELQTPSYASKYPPGQALFLAAGQRAFGHPFYGVLLSNAAMVFAFTLMFCLWLPFRWAIATGVSIAAGLLPPMYWTDSYWGGSVAATGAALVLIAVRVESGALFAAGGALLFFTRPFEGAVFVLAIGACYVRTIRWRTVAAALPLLIAAGGFSLALNRAVTGSAFTLPYVAYDRAHAAAPPLWILARRPEPAGLTPRMAALHGANGWEMEKYNNQQPWPRGIAVGILSASQSVLELFAGTLLPPICGLLVLLIPWIDPRQRRLAIAASACIAVLALETWHFTHYAAPVYAAIAILFGAAAARLSAWRPAGPYLAVLLLALPGLAHFRPPKAESFAADRSRLLAELQKKARPQLVIIHYPAPDWHPHEEWVYNSAEIDSQKVIFAHDLGQDENRALIAYYGNREASLLTPREDGYTIVPYPAP